MGIVLEFVQACYSRADQLTPRFSGRASAIKPFRETTFAFKRGGLGRKLAVEQVAAQVEKRQGGVGDEGGRGGWGTRTDTDLHRRTRTFTDGHGRTLTFTDGHGRTLTIRDNRGRGALCIPAGSYVMLCLCQSVLVRVRL